MNEHLKSLLETFSKIPTREEFVQAFKTVTEIIAKKLIDLERKIDARLAQIQDGKDGRHGRDGEKGDRGERGPQGATGFAMFGARGTDGKDGKDGKDGSPDTGEDIVDKINALPTDDDVDKIDAAHIKNLPKAETKYQPHVHPNVALWSLLDVDVAGIATGQSIKWTGVRWIPYTPAGGASTSVYNEVVAGSATTFTLDNTPDTGTLRVYANGQRLTPTTDYSLSGDEITTVSPWSAGTVTADYDYT